MNIGSLNVVDSIINAELRIAVLERVIDLIMSKTQVSIHQDDIEKIRAEAMEGIIKKYPDLEIKKR